jgi:hypothetical protein
MNGRFDAPFLPLSAGSTTGDEWHPASGARCLALPLVCSCALHLLVLFSPVFGTVASFAPSAVPNSQKAPPSFSVTLTPFHSLRAEDWHPPNEGAAHAELSERDPKPVTKDPLKPTDSRMDGADLLPLPGVIYYPTSFLTVRPQPLAEANLDPPRLRPIVASGKVILTLWINPFGLASKVSVESTNLPEIFTATAVDAFQSLRFKPGELHGQKVGAVMRVEVTYDDGRLISTEILQ